MGNTICGQGRGVTFWGFGHTQRNCKFMVGGRRVQSNQRGHPRGPRGLVSRYDEDLVVWLEEQEDSCYSSSSSSAVSIAEGEWVALP